MPYGMCPLCGSRSHYNLGSHKVWDERYADMPLAPKLCFSCSGPVATGSRVEVRRGVARDGRDLGGLAGVVGRVDSSAEGSLYWVRLPDGSTECLTRSELSPADGPPGVGGGVAEPGAAADPGPRAGQGG